MSLINREALYEKACDLEAQALAYVGKIANDETKIEEWRIWSAILAERTAFKHDIFDAPEVKPEPKWILVSEMLPEEDKDVLVTVYFMGLKQTHSNGWNDHIKPSYYVDIASHIDGEWCSASDEYKIARSRHKVIAWMPLPEPYREEGES